jgi:nitrogen fixation protein FixH
MNWFQKLMLVLVAFVSMMIYFAVRSVKTSLPLVTEKYYEEEIKYQDKINKQQNESSLEQKLVISSQNNKLFITVPETYQASSVTGNVKLYFPADEKKDKEIPLNIVNGNIQEIDVTGLKGLYTVQVDWNYESKDYFTEKKIFF